jgi:single-strand DNA-binding protein
MSVFTINRVVLVGRLTQDPELRALPSGVSVCSLRIACSSARRDAGGEYQEKPNFFDVNVYGTPAENVNSYTRKGRRVAIDGRLEWREWETPDQQKRQAVRIVADTVMFLDSPDGRRVGEPVDEGGTDRGSAGELERGSAGELDQELTGELDQESASELVGVGADTQEDDLIF